MPGLILIAALALSPAGDGPARPFAIRVVDEATGRGVPLIELKTVDSARFVTDNAGHVAFDEPGLMDADVFFQVKGHGYEYPADGFGQRGVRLRPALGGEATIRVRRINVAERLYRIGGGGLYRDSLLLGKPTPLKAPAINALVVGQDSVVNALANGTLYWFWGDTNRPGYPLGNFHVPGATSRLPSQGGLDPDVGIDLDYFVDGDGFARPTARLPGDGPTWIFGVVAIPEAGRKDRIFGTYVKVRNLLDVYEHGAVEFDEDHRDWIKRSTWPEGAPFYPGGQAIQIDEDGDSWVYFARDQVNVRVRAAAADYVDLAKYEAWTPLRPGSTTDKPAVESVADGRPTLTWKRDAPPLTDEVQRRLIREGALRAEDAPIQLRDVDTGRPIRPHSSSLAFNLHRRAWTLIVLESGGTSPLGEVWYAEALHPWGPFVYARKVVTHDRYTFYNPRQHEYFAKDDGRSIYFEGTYTNLFSGNPDETPRYNYNQIMYRLDTDDPRLNVPRPVAALSPEPGVASFFAPSWNGPGLVGHVVGERGRLERSDESRLFGFSVALVDPAATDPPLATMPLIEYVGDDGIYRYTTAPDLKAAGLRKTGRSPGRAWPSPTRQPIRRWSAGTRRRLP